MSDLTHCQRQVRLLERPNKHILDRDLQNLSLVQFAESLATGLFSKEREKGVDEQAEKESMALCIRVRR